MGARFSIRYRVSIGAEELKICTSTPDIPPPPPPVQESKQPEINTLKRDRKSAVSGMSGGTLLTGASGVSNAALTTAAPTLLGG